MNILVYTKEDVAAALGDMDAGISQDLLDYVRRELNGDDWLLEQINIAISEAVDSYRERV